MKLTVIGFWGAYPEKNESSSCYLIEHKDTKVILDCGSGALSQMKNYVETKDLDAVVLSHLHEDHCADIGCFKYEIMIDTLLGKRKKSIDIWAGDSSKKVKSLSYKSYCNGRNYKDLDGFTTGSLKFSVIKNLHDIPSYAIKVTDSDGKVLVYSGDTGFYDELISFSKDASCFLCESSLYSYQHGDIKGHLTAKEAGYIAASANVGHLILTHLPHYGNIDDMAHEAGEKFNNKITVAYKGLSVII